MPENMHLNMYSPHILQITLQRHLGLIHDLKVRFRSIWRFRWGGFFVDRTQIGRYLFLVLKYPA